MKTGKMRKCRPGVLAPGARVALTKPYRVIDGGEVKRLSRGVIVEELAGGCGPIFGVKLDGYEPTVDLPFRLPRPEEGR